MFAGYFLGICFTYFVWCTVIHRSMFGIRIGQRFVMSCLVLLWPVGLPILMYMLWEEKK
jgi:hypothetical protein